LTFLDERLLSILLEFGNKYEGLRKKGTKKLKTKKLDRIH